VKISNRLNHLVTKLSRFLNARSHAHFTSHFTSTSRRASPQKRPQTNITTDLLRRHIPNWAVASSTASTSKFLAGPCASPRTQWSKALTTCYALPSRSQKRAIFALRQLAVDKSIVSLHHPRKQKAGNGSARIVDVDIGAKLISKSQSEKNIGTRRSFLMPSLQPPWEHAQRCQTQAPLLAAHNLHRIL
jgi:hypothetical protein